MGVIVDGRLCWVARASQRLDAAIDFYESVVGWTTSPVLVIDADYRLAYRGAPGPDSAAVGFDAGRATQAFGTAWTGDLLIENLDTALQRSDVAGGGKVLDRSEVPHMGEQILLREPGGAPIRLWAPLPDSPADPANTNWSAVPYAELWSTAPALTRAWLADVFGLRFERLDELLDGPATWRAVAGGQTSFVLRDARTVPQLGGSCWVPFFACSVVAPCLSRALSAGGRELPRHPPCEESLGLRLGWCTDADGLPIGFAAEH